MAVQSNSSFSKFINDLVNTFNNAKNWVTGTYDNAKSKIENSIKDTLGKTIDFTQNAKDVYADVIKDMTAGATNILDNSKKGTQTGTQTGIGTGTQTGIGTGTQTGTGTGTQTGTGTGTQTGIGTGTQTGTGTGTQTNEKSSYYDSLLDTFNNYSESLYDNYTKQSELATAQAYALKRKQQQDAEQSFYNQLYDTNATVLDTIRRNNAAAIASGASKGAQAANELSTILQGQQASVDAATQLAQSNYDLASEEAEAYITAEQAARQQADTTAGALAGNLAVAAQADAAVKAADINAETVTKTSEVYQLQDAVKKYLDPNADETTKTTNRLIIEALTGQTLNDLGFKTTTTETADSNIKDIETTVAKYDSIINNSDNPTVAKRYIEQAINSYNQTGGSRVVKVLGKSDSDLETGYMAVINYGDKDYSIHLIGGQIKYDNIKNDVLKATIDNASDGDPIKIDGEYYAVDKTGNNKPILQKIAIYKNQDFYKDFVAGNGIHTSEVPNFTNKKNN